MKNNWRQWIGKEVIDGYGKGILEVLAGKQAIRFYSLAEEMREYVFVWGRKGTRCYSIKSSTKEFGERFQITPEGRIETRCIV